MLVLTKAELLDAAQRLQALEALQGALHQKPVPLLISAVTGEGLDGLLNAVWQCLAIEPL